MINLKLHQLLSSPPTHQNIQKLIISSATLTPNVASKNPSLEAIDELGSFEPFSVGLLFLLLDLIITQFFFSLFICQRLKFVNLLVILDYFEHLFFFYYYYHPTTIIG